MPSASEKQKRTMLAAAHNPSFARKMGIPKMVAQEFVAADKAKDNKPKESQKDKIKKRYGKK